jgi:hypothetical protein
MSNSTRNILIIVAAVLLMFIFRRLIAMVIVIGLVALLALAFYTILRLKN